MKTINIEASCGMEMHNLPQEIYPLVSNCLDIDGGLRLEVPIDADAELVLNHIVRNMFNHNISVERGVPNFISIYRDCVEDDENDDVCEQHDDDIDEEQGGEQPESSEMISSGTFRIPDIGGTTLQGNRVGIIPQMPVNTVRLNDGDATIMIAAHMENQTSSLAKNLQDKQREFAKIWTKSISLKREIDEATVAIDNVPIISKLISQVNELKSEDNLIEDIFFTTNYIVALTKELITTEAINGCKRLIGKMEIKIGIKPIVCNATESEMPVIIKNLDRKYNDGANIWECGHVKDSGNSICWGDAWEILYNAMTLRDVPSIIEVILRFIRQPNIQDSWGRHMANWPETH